LLVVGFQGAALLLAPTALNVAIGVQSAGLDDVFLTWSVFAALLISALVTLMQALQLWRFGAGHIVLTSPAAMFIAIMVATVSAAGPSTFMGLLIVCSVVQVALAWWLPALRRIFTPVVTGTVTMLIAASVLPIAFDSVQDLPADVPNFSGPLIAGVTLLALVFMTLRAGGRWRIAGPFISIAAGCAVGAGFGLFDADRIIAAAWFGIPELPPLTLDVRPDKEFWALLPAFAILTLVLGIKTISDGTAIQQGSWRRRRAIDFRQIQGMVTVNGLGMLFAGFTSTLPPMSYSSFSISLINLTGVAARRVGIGVAVVLVAAAFISKLAALLLAIPGPVLGAYLMLAMGMLFVSGWQTILRDGLDPRRAVVVAVATALGLGLQNHPIMRELLGDEIGNLLGNGITIGALVAIGMTFVLEAVNARRSRLDVTLEMASLPAIDEFLAQLATSLGWNDSSSIRLRAAGEETLASLLALEVETPGAKRPRLVIDARPRDSMVELDFVATTRAENVEDQLAYLAAEVDLPAADDISLRLLRSYATTVRHKKFHGVDIVSVQVKGTA
jgi:NCS2 family nucleobase:cation symporter-2/xanthine permease XanP